MPLPNKLTAEEFISLRIAGVYELRKHFEMWLLDPHRSAGPFAVLQEEEIPQPRPNRLVKRTVTVGSPEIKCASHRLLGAVVEVVTEGRTDLGLRFKGQYQLVIPDNKEVPFLRGSEKPGQFQGLIVKDMFAGNP